MLVASCGAAFSSVQVFSYTNLGDPCFCGVGWTKIFLSPSVRGGRRIGMQGDLPMAIQVVTGAGLKCT